MKILVSNDDGIFSPGLIALAEVASQFGDVLIFSPDFEQSAVDHHYGSITPLRLDLTDNEYLTRLNNPIPQAAIDISLS